MIENCRFPKAEVPPEEMVRRQRVEAERLARLSPGEWQLWIDNSAAQLGIPRATLEASVKAIIAQQEKDKRERKAEAERAEKAAMRKRREQAKKKQQEFKVLAELPERDQEARLDDLAKRLEEDPATVREEFALSTSSPDPESVELWPEAVETAALLSELIQQLRRFIVFRHDTDATAVALWIMFSWIHAVATHSPNLVVTSPEPDCGKTTLLGVLGRLTPRPVSGVELTGPALYRMVDRDRPTLIVDEADDLLHRKPDLKHIVNAGWSRGTKIPRSCRVSSVSLIRFVPRLSRSKARRCRTPRRAGALSWTSGPSGLMRRSRSLCSPTLPSFWNCGANWRGGVPIMRPRSPNRSRHCHPVLIIVWPPIGDCCSRLPITPAVIGPSGHGRRRQALSRQTPEPSAGIRLLTALQEIFANRTEITSAELVQLLVADPDAEWGAFRGRAAISQRELAALLKPYDVRPVVLHPSKRSNLSRHGYRREQFENAFARFLPADIRTSEHQR